MGLMAKNILEFNESGYRENSDTLRKSDNFSLPMAATLGVSWKSPIGCLALDNEIIYGKYGGFSEKTAKFWFIRGGAERKMSNYVSLRAGIIVPVIAETSTLGDIRNDLPAPKFGGSIGIGFACNHLKADFALSGDPGKSYIDNQIRIMATAGIRVYF
jgi:hypothetical protein